MQQLLKICILAIVLQLLFIIPTNNPHHHKNNTSCAVYAYEEQATPQSTSESHPQQRKVQTNNNNNLCSTQTSSTSPSSSSIKTINEVLTHLDTRRAQIESTIFIRYTDHYENVTVPSTQFTYEDFRSSLEYMATVGIDNGKFKFYMGPDTCNNDGWHVGLANVATFLSQSMSLAILNDTCEELNWEQVFPNPEGENPKGYYPLANACGQRGISYTTSTLHTCPVGEERYQCTVNSKLQITSTSQSLYDSSPPPLKCFSRTADKTVTGYFDPYEGRVINKKGAVIPSKTGRTDVEGCCYWGRGALHTGGICNMGKLDYYMGSKASREGRQAKYPDINFCTNPNAICNPEDNRSRILRWDVAFFEWIMNVQSYDSQGGEDAAAIRWNYMDEMTKFVNFGGDIIDSTPFNHFIDEVGGILDQGCPYPPCINGNDPPNRLYMQSERKQNFITSMTSIGLPVKSDLYRVTENHLTSPTIKKGFEETILMSQSPVDGKTYTSSRYRHFNDFIESLRKMADVGFDNDKYFYIGQGSNGDGEARLSNPGLLNIALFLTYAIEMSILDDACDEHNTQLINGRFPVSNSCGQDGKNYQDIVCNTEDAGMECTLDIKQSFSAVTSSFDPSAPQPFKCAPKTQYQVTGFWDEDQLEENHQTAYSNQVGRVDIEGCCWWGRGVLRHVTHGRCIFGQMNYYIGMRAANEGRPSLYPNIDFCKFPEAVCASEHSNQLRWVSGLFYWTKNVQPYSNGGWSYMNTIKKLASDVFQSGKLDTAALMSIDCVLKTGSHNCDSAEDMTDRLNEVLSLISVFNLPTASPTATLSPSASPTDFPTVRPTLTPTTNPTVTASPSASPNIFSYPSKDDVDTILKILTDKATSIKSKLLTPKVGVEDANMYSFEVFLSSLRVLAVGTIQGVYFYIGHNVSRDRAYRKRGMVNVAAFLSYAKTVAVYNTVCDEQNVDRYGDKYPLSNACGQYGSNYQNMRCDPNESHMECPPDPSLQMTAVAPLATSDAQPPPFFCGSREYFPSTGYYNGETKLVMNDEPFANRAGRTDVQSCCFWGRGAAQVKGACLYGKLNYYIGARAEEEGRRSLFPTVDFCQYPQAICSGQFSYNLMWITGMFAWIELIQSQSAYSEFLENYVADEMNDEEFIAAVSDILGSSERERIDMRVNFILAIDAVGLNQF